MSAPEATTGQPQGGRGDAAPSGQETGLTQGVLAVLVATACWATSGIFINFILASGELSALALAFWRDLATFAALLIGLSVLRPGWLCVAWRDLKWLAGLGSIGLGTFHVLWNLNVMLNGVAVATVQQAAMPIIVAVAAYTLWREPLTHRKKLAIVLTFAGTVLISGLDVVGKMRVNVPGLLVGLGTPTTYAAYNLFGKPIAGRYHPLTILAYGFGFGALILLPFQFFTPQPWSVSGLTWLWFVVLIGFATIVPFSAYTFGLGRLPASVAGILAMAEIPFAALYAHVLLSERLSAMQMGGAALVVGGVLLLFWRRAGRGKRGPKQTVMG